MAPFRDGAFEPGGPWERRALRVLETLAAESLIEPRDIGYADALMAAGRALDLAESSGVSGQIEYARRGWSASLKMLTPPPSERSPRRAGVSATDADRIRTEFERLAESFYTDGAADVHDTP